MAIKYKKFGVNNTAGSTPQNWFMLCYWEWPDVWLIVYESPHIMAVDVRSSKTHIFWTGNELDRDRAKKTVQMFLSDVKCRYQKWEQRYTMELEYLEWTLDNYGKTM